MIKLNEKYECKDKVQNQVIYKIIEIAKQQKQVNKIITRDDVKRIVLCVGKMWKVKLCGRWFQNFIKNNKMIKSLVTHGNSINKKKK